MLRTITTIIGFIGLSNLLFAQIQLLNDEFNDSRSLINWKNINQVEKWGIEQLEHYSINDTTAGKMVMIPRTASWFGGYRGPLLYKEVSGDFVVTIKVDVQGRNAALPTEDYNLAGIMLRHVREYPDGALGANGWMQEDNNYMFLSIGAAATNHHTCNPCAGPHFEVKNTLNGTSDLRVVQVDTTSTQIRVVRNDSAFIIMYRLETDQQWVVHERYCRADFPDTIQVGLVTYTDWQKVSSYISPFTHNSTQIEGNECNTGPACNPDIIGEFEFIRFDSLDIPMGLGSNWNDPGDVTDSELLSFLSFVSQRYCPNSIHIDSPVDSNSFLLVEASSSISISDSVGTNGILLLSATDSVHLTSGFNVDTGAIIEVDNIGCN